MMTLLKITFLLDQDHVYFLAHCGLVMIDYRADLANDTCHIRLGLLGQTRLFALYPEVNLGQTLARISS